MKCFFFILLSCSCLARTDSVAVTFTLFSPAAESVSVVGSFSQWSKKFPLTKDSNGTWRTTLPLPPQYYYYKFIVDSNWIPDPKNPLKVNDGGTGFNSIIKVGTPSTPLRRRSSIPFPRDKVPKPVLPSHPDWINLYYAAWQVAWQKISRGNEQNGFVESYMDEGFNEMIYQWDTNFMVLFGIYARDVFPAIQSLDNFYSKQRKDGYIQRVYSEESGLPAAEPTKAEPMVNPPLFAWTELRYAQISGDTTRLGRILPILIKYFDWMEKNTQSDSIKNLYYNTPLGSGMDNTPRPNVERGGWIDPSAQQALAAKSIAQIAGIINDPRTRAYFELKSRQIALEIAKYNWSAGENFFFDIGNEYQQSGVKHIGAFWTLLADIRIPDRNAFIDHLRNPKEFLRPHMVPTLSADDSSYNPGGHYWRGSVWAPTNYMIVKGLEQHQLHSLADSIAENHITNISEVFRKGILNDSMIAYEERYGDGYTTIWECYSPEYPSPATRWDDTFLSRQDFVGWSGLGPLSMLIENVLGIQLNGLENKITWRIRIKEEHGIEKILLRNQKVSLRCQPTPRGISISVLSERPFVLTVLWNKKSYILAVKKKKESFEFSI